ncbi:hypothetical protein GOBAR_AA00748 [Gossypium barbadense]|uniref:Rotamase n=1 Tax=Gossypium barbadense TaxID=3634 RepID=A0A2P5YW42_GOSBA|nr:hypothetical protein GOBAR_AA00748 [Gossypium barbadense]
MASISATGFLPQSLTLSSATARASTRRPIACLSAQLQQQQPPSQRIERRKIMVIGAVGLVAPALWDSSNGEIEMAMAASSGFTDMPALRGKDYGKTKMRYPDYTETVSGLQYKDLRVGDGPTPKMGDTVVGIMAAYLKLETRPKAVPLLYITLPVLILHGDDKDFFKFRLGSQEVIPAFEEAITGMALGGVRIIVPPELGYPDNDYNKSGPKPTTFSVKFKSLIHYVVFFCSYDDCFRCLPQGKAPAQLVGPGSVLDWLRLFLTEGRGLLVHLPRPMADLGAYWLLISTTEVFPMVCILEFL